MARAEDAAVEEVKWIGLVVNGGSFALLTFLAVWLTKWVPTWIERANQARESEAKSRHLIAEDSRKAQIDKEKIHLEQMKAMLLKFDADQKYEREACERHHRELLEAAQRRQQEVLSRIEAAYLLNRENRHVLGNILQYHANQRALEKMDTGVVEDLKRTAGINGAKL